MIYYLLANCFSALSNILNKFFIKNDFFSEGIKMLDITFHANIINFFVFIIYYNYCKIHHNVQFSFEKTFFQKKEIIQIILFGIPVYAAAFKISMLQTMPVPYVEVSAMIKPFIVFCLALFLLHEKFHSYYIIYGVLVIFGFMVSHYNKIFNPNFTSNDGDLLKIIYYIGIASIGDITRRYYCRKWDNAMQAICVEITIFALYGFLYLSFTKRFSLHVFLNPCTYIYSTIAFLHHTCIIHGVQRASSVAALELLNFSKIIFTLVFSTLIIKEVPSRYQLLGALIIGGTLFVFNIHRKKKEQEEKKSKKIEEEDEYISDEEYSRKCFEKEKNNDDDDNSDNSCSYDGEDYNCKKCNDLKNKK